MGSTASPSPVVAQAEALLLANKPEQASAVLDTFLAEATADADALHMRALAAASLGDGAKALNAICEALRIREEPSWFRDLGALYYAMGKPRDALRSFQTAVRLGADDPDLLAFCGHALLGGARPLKALRFYERVSAVRPNDALMLRSRAIAMLATGRCALAIQLLEKACDVEPNSCSGHEWLAHAYIQSGRFDMALLHRRIAFALRDRDLPSERGIFHSLWLTGQVEECLQVGKSMLARGFIDPVLHFSYVTALDHFTEDAEESRQAWRHWAAVHRHPPSLSNRPTADDPKRVLRIGYLVDEIDRTPDWHYIPPLLECRDRLNFETFCYLTTSVTKSYPARLSRLAESTRDLRKASVEEIAQRVTRDRIDILVNVSWMQRPRHLMVFSRRPVPIQVELPNYPGTTGLTETDYIFSDEWICPPGDESIYTEKVFRLTASYMPWRPPQHAPAITRSPINRNGFCTFGFFQRPIKLNPNLWNAFAAILQAVPRSRLLIHQRSRDIEDRTSETRTRYVREMSSRGIDETRLVFIGLRSAIAHYGVVSKADIALDSFPYNGTTTTGDCLWMGVPVITLAGTTHASRVSLSMLSRVGLPEFAASSNSEYIGKAVALAHDRERLGSLRCSLRQRMKSSDLTNAATVMAGIESAYRLMWENHCRPENLDMSLEEDR